MKIGATATFDVGRIGRQTGSKNSLYLVSEPGEERAVVRPCIRIIAPLFTPEHLISHSCAETKPTRLNAA
jgi:hypothetical protein